VGLREAGSRSVGCGGVRLGCLGRGLGWAGDWVCEMGRLGTGLGRENPE
jgi:hypothetical protein